MEKAQASLTQRLPPPGRPREIQGTKVKSDESADPAKSVFKHKISPRESPGPLVCFALSTYVSALLNPGQNAVVLYEYGPDPVALSNADE